MHTRLLTLLLTMVALVCACKPNESADERHKIVAGKWFLQHAQVDGNETSRLEGAVFTFDNGVMNTNIPQIGSGAYSFNKEKIVQKGEQEVEYTIEEISNGRLVLNTTLRTLIFRLEFSRDSLINE
jgi:hypothetical protein